MEEQNQFPALHPQSGLRSIRKKRHGSRPTIKGEATETKGREHSYLDLYQPATLTVAGKTLTAKPEIDGPYGDQFTLPAGTPQFRYLGVVHYTFDLTGLPTSGSVTLNFKDSGGKAYTQKADLSQLR